MAEEEIEAIVRRQNPAEERLVKLSVWAEIQGLGLVEQGLFPSFDEMVETAVVALASGFTTGSSHRPVRGRARPERAQVDADELTVPYVAKMNPPDLTWTSEWGSLNFTPVPAVPQDRLVSPILQFTIPRLLPVKLWTRVLLSELGGRGRPWIDLDEADRILGPQALQWREYLYRLDRSSNRTRGKRLSTALPSGKRDVGKSLSRFRSAYAGFGYKDGRLYGAAPFLGFTSLEGSQDDLRVGLTENGFHFATMENPVFDGEKNVFPPFSEDEVNFLLTKLSDRSPTEAEHVAFYLRHLRDATESTRESVNRAMRHFYETIWNPLTLTDGLVDSTRMALHSRCQELGLAGTVRIGRKATYLATADGLDWIPKLSRGTGGLPEVSA